MKEHEKFIAFILLGAALMTLAVILYLRPLADSSANSGVLQILNMIIGAMISGFGAATQALFRIKDSVTVDNTKENPVQTEPAEPTAESEPSEELPSYAR